tara:strand:+ start:10551 stop:11405 length:855 start_codon:yes stop_codon:yes gene_type:complete
MVNDAAASYANNLKGSGWLKIYNEGAGLSRELKFKAFLTDFSDSYETNRSDETIFGRNDPNVVFAGTVRKLTAKFMVPSFSVADGQHNLAYLQEFIQYLYPSYSASTNTKIKGTGAQGFTRIKSPTVRVKFANLISGDNKPNTSAKVGGLMMFLDGFTFTPNVDAGFLFTKEKLLVPKEVELVIAGIVNHDHLTGFNVTDAKRPEFFRENFPYGMGYASQREADTAEAVDTFNAANAALIAKMREEQEAKKGSTQDKLRKSKEDKMLGRPTSKPWGHRPRKGKK